MEYMQVVMMKDVLAIPKVIKVEVEAESDGTSADCNNGVVFNRVEEEAEPLAD
jgi:hypothetical protein